MLTPVQALSMAAQATTASHCLPPTQWLLLRVAKAGLWIFLNCVQCLRAMLRRCTLYLTTTQSHGARCLARGASGAAVHGPWRVPALTILRGVNRRREVPAEALTFGDVTKIAHDFALVPQLLSLSSLLRLFRQVTEEDAAATAVVVGTSDADGSALDVLSFPQLVEVLGRVALQVRVLCACHDAHTLTHRTSHASLGRPTLPQAYTLKHPFVPPGEAATEVLRQMDGSAGLRKMMRARSATGVVPRFSVRHRGHRAGSKPSGGARSRRRKQPAAIARAANRR